MNIILGASGQVGSAVTNYLIKDNQPVKGVIRNPQKADHLEKKGVKVSIADYFDLKALKHAIKDGDVIFLLTPEDKKSNDVLGETKVILKNYRDAIEDSKIRKIVGLSSIGAQHKSGTGNLLMSYMLEHTFTHIMIPQVYIRPAYYYSSWLPFLSTVTEQRILPTFFPADLQIPMISPIDVAKFTAEKIADGTQESGIYELTGPESYSSNDVANAFSNVLGHQVTAQQIPKEHWKETLLQAGFTNNAAENLIAMTEAVIHRKAIPERKGTNPLKLQTGLKQYIKESIR